MKCRKNIKVEVEIFVICNISIFMQKNRIKIEKILLSNILNEIFLCFYYIKRVKKIKSYF